MNLAMCMSHLGLDPRTYLLNLSRLGREARVTAARIMMVEAKRAAKAKMAQHHPDRGGSHDEFVRISASLDHIIKETETFIAALEERAKEAAEKSAKTPRIVIGD